MYCSECGAQNDDQETRCFRCNALMRPNLTPPTPPPVQNQPPPMPLQQPCYPPPGAIQPYQPYAPPGPLLPDYVPNHMGLAIASLVLGSVSLLLCCLPVGIVFGILSVVNASQVNNKLGMGDGYGAMQASKNARLFGWVGIVSGGGILLLGIGWIIFNILIAFTP